MGLTHSLLLWGGGWKHQAAAERGWLNEKAAVMEAMTCFKRAGTDIILTYYAKQAAMWLAEDGLI